MPKDERVFCALVRCHANLEQFEEAAQVVGEMERAFGSVPLIGLLRAEVLRKSKQLREALECLEGEGVGETAEGLYEIGCLKWELGMRQESWLPFVKVGTCL